MKHTEWNLLSVLQWMQCSAHTRSPDPESFESVDNNLCWWWKWITAADHFNREALHPVEMRAHGKLLDMTLNQLICWHVAEGDPESPLQILLMSSSRRPRWRKERRLMKVKEAFLTPEVERRPTALPTRRLQKHGVLLLRRTWTPFESWFHSCVSTHV